METIELTQHEFDAIETNRTGIIAKEGLVIKKQAGEEWVLLSYGSSDKEGNFEINVKKIIIK